MVRGRVSKKRNREKKRHMKKYNRNPEIITAVTENRKPLPMTVPETHCVHCQPKNDKFDKFDEHDYPLPSSLIPVGQAVQSRAIFDATTTLEKPFRFFDLPAELRNYIYELAMYKPNQPTCIPDRVLRPLEGPLNLSDVRRHCSKTVTCVPCQLHMILGTGQMGLSRANKQLHDETALIPYAINTFSVHNLYYLYAFLNVIGPAGWKALKSLQFTWKLPEEEAHALKQYTPVQQTYALLNECTNLNDIAMGIDVINLLTWRSNGNPRSMPLTYLNEIPDVEMLCQLRGLKEITLCWPDIQGIFGMEKWARTTMGIWRMPRRTATKDAVPVNEGSTFAKVKNTFYLMWNAKLEKEMMSV